MFMRMLPLSLLVGCVQITGTIEEACLPKTGLAIEGLPAEAGADTPLIQHSFVIDDFDALNQVLDLGLEAEVYFTGTKLRSGSQKLDFVREIQLVGSSRDLPLVDLGSCAHETCAADSELLLNAAEVDVMEYIDTGMIDLSLTVAGDLPREEWALDVDICVRGTLSFEANL